MLGTLADWAWRRCDKFTVVEELPTASEDSCRVMHLSVRYARQTKGVVGVQRRQTTRKNPVTTRVFLTVPFALSKSIDSRLYLIYR